MFEIIEKAEESGTSIKVFGVGGAGVFPGNIARRETGRVGDIESEQALATAAQCRDEVAPVEEAPKEPKSKKDK